MESRGFLTKRGRRLVGMIGAAGCWAVSLTLLITATLLTSDGARGFALAMTGVAASWTVCLAVSRNGELVKAAFEVGKEVGRDSVRSIR